MPKRATLIRLREEERATFLQATKWHKSEQQLVLRTQIVQEASEGKSTITTSYQSVWEWPICGVTAGGRASDLKD